MEHVFPIMLGVGLAAACGFRVFVPMLALSAAAMGGHVKLSENFAWLGTETAFVILLVATILEIGAYFIPWVDNLLDAAAGPTAVVAGTLVTAASIDGMSPAATWTLAAILGGGAAGVVQAGTTLTRLASTAATGGVGNPVVSTGEAAGAVTMSAAAIFLPPVAIAGLLGMTFLAGRAVWRRLRKSRSAGRPEESPAGPAGPAT